MDTKKLRQKILDLAIRGKLVPQDPNDEPASALLERIRAEKERLIKEGKIKRSKKSASDTPRYENVPFEVPEGWEWTTINDICSKIGSGSTPRGSNYAEEGIPFFRSQNVYNDGLVYDDIKYITEDVHKMMIGTEVQANDLLLNITGGSLGRCAIVPNEFCKGNVSQHVCILRTIIVLPAYLHLFIISDYFAATMILSGSGREGLPKYSLEIMQFPLPPLTEQHRIVTTVEQWFSLIDTLETAKEDLQTSIAQVKSKILDLAIHGKLVPQDPNDEPAIELLKRINPKFTPCDNAQSKKMPIGWICCSLKDVAIILDNMRRPIKTEERNKRSKGKSILYPYYGATGIAGYIDDFLLEGKYILLGEDGAPFLDKYAKKAYEAKGRIWVNNHAHILDPKIDFLYLLHYLNTIDYSHFVKGTTRLKLTQADMSSIKIMLPPLSEQKSIVSKIEELFAVLDEIQKSIEA